MKKRLLAGLVLVGMLMVSFTHSRAALAATTEVSCDVPSLIAAINAANSAPGPDTLDLTEGCLYAYFGGDNTAPDNTSNALPVISTEIVMNGHDATLYCGYGNRCFWISSTGNLTVNDLTVKGAHPLTPQHDSGSGGGFYVDGGMLTVTRGTIAENHVGVVVEFGGGGAGAGIKNQNGILVVSDSLFEHNGADFAGAIDNQGTMTIDNSIFRKNGAAVGAGAMYHSGSGLGIIRHSLFKKNRARADERVNDTYAGAIANSAELLIQDTNFAGNQANIEGGAIQNNGTLTVQRSTFAKNHAHFYGGAIFNRGTLKAANTTFYENHARGGGGVFNEGEATLIHTTLYRNNGQYYGGGNISSSNNLTLENSIIAEGMGANCAGKAPKSKGVNLRYPTSDTSCAGIFGDPQFGAIANHGGFGPTLEPARTSPAVDAAADKSCARALVEGLDGNGRTRPQDGDGDNKARCDIGAVELRALP